MKQAAILGMVAACSLGAASWDAPAQIYPSKAIRLITAAPGGGNEFLARVMAQAMTPSLGQQIVVDSRPGGNGAIAALAVSRAPADGYTLLFYSSALWVVPLMRDMPWDTLKDFAPVTLVAIAPNVLVVHPSLPVRSVADLVKLAKSRPGELNYASGGSGAAAHLAAELFKHIAHVKITRVMYKGTGYGITATISGEVQLMFPSVGSVLSHVKAGQLKALAVTSAQPSEVAPGLPTLAASGLPGYEAVSVYGIFAPAKTPAPIVDRLYRESVQVLRQPDVKSKLLNSGVEVVAGSPDDFSAYIRTDVARWDKVIKQAGLREQ